MCWRERTRSLIDGELPPSLTQWHAEETYPTMPQAKTAKPEQFVDMSFLQELEKEGFFNEMAKRYPGK